MCFVCTAYSMTELWTKMSKSAKSSVWMQCTVPEAIFFHGRHGNAEIQMRTKFHFHALYGVQV